MSVFLTKIQIQKVFHLKDISIELNPNKKRHLILTGKNGSGKTSLLDSIVDSLQVIKGNNTGTGLRQHGNAVNLEFNNIDELAKKLRVREFILAFYSATRKTQVIVPKNPDKPNLIPISGIKSSKIGEFLKFLVDLKVQEALARNENEDKAADEIKKWFVNFTALLQNLFEGDPLSLDFNFKNYSFTINQSGRKFGFNELSDGYSAIVDIVADLIIKMQDANSLSYAYEKEGIVLIDEVETHLHLKLQRLILPMLTQIFPNIQFIVTTHSPFVLSSLKDAIAYDLEKQTRLEDLTEYSYESLAEGYFKVDTESGVLISKLGKFKTLAEISEKDSAELAEYKSLDEEFASMDDALAPPNIKGQYLQIKLNEK
jgi:predicted ATP-binding protein involved in virulence